MEQEIDNPELKSIRVIEGNLSKILNEVPTMNELIDQLSEDNIFQLSNKMMSILEYIEDASPQVEKFNRTVVYASKERVKIIESEDKDKNKDQNSDKDKDEMYVIETCDNPTRVETYLHENLGILESAVAEQIELIDSDKKENLTYEDLNGTLSTRIFYTNKTIDMCIDHLLKKL